MSKNPTKCSMPERYPVESTVAGKYNNKEQKAKSYKLSADEVIRIAVETVHAVKARDVSDMFKATEKRLYAYPVLIKRIEGAMEEKAEIEGVGVKEYSGSILLAGRGSALSGEDKVKALLCDLEYRILMDEREIKKLDKALDIIRGEPYSDLVHYKYFEGRSDGEIGKILYCDERTVRRHKSRLVGQMAVYLYGVCAVA